MARRPFLNSRTGSVIESSSKTVMGHWPIESSNLSLSAMGRAPPASVCEGERRAADSTRPDLRIGLSWPPGPRSGKRRHAMATAEGYARPELLAEPDWLWERRDDPKVRIIDCASLDRYRRAHIPGAVGLPVDGWLKDSENKLHVMGPKAFAELMEKLGVSDDTTVVAYDDNQMFYATRLWWVLSHYGHANARVLNGVWYRWMSEGRPVTFKETVPELGRFTPRPDQSVICRLDYLRSKFDGSDTQALDVRPDGEWSGKTNDFGNKRTGHIPGGLHLFAQKFLTDDDRRTVRPALELRTLLKDAGVQPGKEVIVHCQAGIRTTQGVFALRLMGWDQVRAYDAAMAEWANQEDTPLVAESELAVPNP